MGERMTTLEDSIEINATPEQIFAWFTKIGSGRNYQGWHPDHVSWQWITGKPFQKGSVAVCEEYIHGRLHRLKFLCTNAVPNRLIEYRPTFPWSIYMPKAQFDMEPRGTGSCIFTATISFRIGPIFLRFDSKRVNALDRNMAALRQHMKEEGENLKRILER